MSLLIIIILNQLFYIYIITRFSKIFFHDFDSGSNKTFFSVILFLCWFQQVDFNLGLGHKNLTLITFFFSPWVPICPSKMYLVMPIHILRLPKHVFGFCYGCCGLCNGLLVPITSPSILNNISPKHVWASSIFSIKKKWIASRAKKRKKNDACNIFNQWVPTKFLKRFTSSSLNFSMGFKVLKNVPQHIP